MTRRKRLGSAEPTDREPLLTVPEAAVRCRLSPRQMWRYIKARKLRVVRFGGRVRIRVSDLDAFINDHLE